IPAATYSPTRSRWSIGGSGGLNFRVRDGNGWNDWRPMLARSAMKKRRPAARVIARRGVWGKIPAATYSPTRKPCSTIGSGGLNFRVRDGNGWDPSDVATGKRVAYAQVVSSRAAEMVPRSTLAFFGNE